VSVKVRERTEGKGGWEVDISVKLPNGKRIRERVKSPCKSKSASRTWGEERAKFLARGEGEKPVKPAATEAPTFAEFAVEFLAHQDTVNKKTSMRSNRSMFLYHLVPAFGSLRLDQIDARAISAYTVKKLTETTRRSPAKKISRKTVNNHLITLGRALSLAQEWGLITAVPKITRPKKTEPPFRFLGFDEAETYLRTAAEHWPDRWLLLFFAIRTGLRLGELRALRWAHLNLTRRNIRVVESYTDEGGLESTKSDKERDVPIAKDIAAELGRLASEQPRKPASLVFTDEDGRTRLTRGQVSHVVERVGRLAGLDGMHPHALRHTFASHCVMRGVPLVQVQRWMGHSTIEMTCKYAHLSPEFGAGMIDRLVDGWSPDVED
jgi:integrase